MYIIGYFAEFSISVIKVGKVSIVRTLRTMTKLKDKSR